MHDQYESQQHMYELWEPRSHDCQPMQFPLEMHFQQVMQLCGVFQASQLDECHIHLLLPDNKVLKSL